MGQGHDSSRLTLARVKKLAEEIEWVGQRSHQLGDNQFNRGFTYAGMCGGLESILVHLAGSTCGQEGQALIEAAFKAAYAPRAAAPVDQPAQVAL